MIIVDDINSFEYMGSMAVSIGKFDGFHLGHDEIVHHLLSYKDKGFDICVVTFKEPPLAVLTHENDIKVLTTNAEKKRIFEELGFDYYIELPFDESIRCMEPSEFAQKILLRKLNMKACVLGTDLRFGHNGAGNAALLEKLGDKYDFAVKVIDKVMLDNEIVSSTYIRQLILDGNVEIAARFLKIPYHIYGQVVHGRQIGRTISIPTVNLIPVKDKLLPPFGVYISMTEYNGKSYRSITNIGCKPTISGSKPDVSAETYIFDFDNQIYNEYINVSLLKFVRGEMKFDSIDELKAQMELDVKVAEEYYVNQADQA